MGGIVLLIMVLLRRRAYMPREELVTPELLAHRDALIENIRASARQRRAS